MTRRKFENEEERMLAKKARQKVYEIARKGGVRLPTSRLSSEEATSLEKIYELAPGEFGKCKMVLMCIEFSLDNPELFKQYLIKD